MTITTTTPITEYDPDGVATNYSYEFYIQNENQICALIDGVLINPNDYTVNGVRNANGGNIDFDAPPDGDLLELVRLLPEIQETQYPKFGRFPAQSHEDALDYLTMLAQQQQFTINQNSNEIDNLLTRVAALEAIVNP